MIHDKNLAKMILDDYQAAMRMMLEKPSYQEMIDFIESCDMICGICYYANKRYEKFIYQDMIEAELGITPIQIIDDSKEEIVNSLQRRIDFLKTQI